MARLLNWSYSEDNTLAHTQVFGLGLQQRSEDVMPAQDRVVIDPAVHHGKPVIRGTRLPITVVVGSLAGGMTFEQVEREYDITAADIRAALKFVAELAEQESFHPLPAA